MVPNGFDLIVRLLSMFKWNQPQPPKTSYNSPYQSFSVFKIGQKTSILIKNTKTDHIWYNFLIDLKPIWTFFQCWKHKFNSALIRTTFWKIKWNDSDHTGIILSLKIITIFDNSKPVRKKCFLVIPQIYSLSHVF